MNKTKIIAGIELGSSKTVTIVAQVVTDELYVETVEELMSKKEKLHL